MADARLTCWQCSKLLFSLGTPDYSDVTPGEPAELGCAAGVWTKAEYDNEHDIREKLFMAERCEQFEDFGQR